MKVTFMTGSNEGGICDVGNFMPLLITEVVFAV